ncbi:hypothetical protein E2320_018851, partial [Naja naja]
RSSYLGVLNAKLQDTVVHTVSEACWQDYFQSNVDELSEDMKEGLRHLAKTLQLYLKVEIQDVSQLLPALDIFQIFAK